MKVFHYQHPLPVQPQPAAAMMCSWPEKSSWDHPACGRERLVVFLLETGDSLPMPWFKALAFPPKPVVTSSDGRWWRRWHWFRGRVEPRGIRAAAPHLMPWAGECRCLCSQRAASMCGSLSPWAPNRASLPRAQQAARDSLCDAERDI